VYSTFLDSSTTDEASLIALDDLGNAYHHKRDPFLILG
jgi:hypothetical protein